MAIAAQMNTLQHIFSLNNNDTDTHIDASHVLKTMYDWVHVENKTAMLRFVYQRKCTFLREETVKTGVIEVKKIIGDKKDIKFTKTIYLAIGNYIPTTGMSWWYGV